MTARTHDLAAITALGLGALLLPVQRLTLSTVLVALLANQIGGIVPDIDQPTAPFWRNLPIGRLFGKAFDMLIGGHRFLSHSLLGVSLFGFLANLLLHFLQPIMPSVDVELVWYAFLIGVLSHLVMDTLTKEGVPWLLPIPIKFGIPPIKRLRITTDTWREHLVIAPVLLFVDVWLFVSHYDVLVRFMRDHIVR